MNRFTMSLLTFAGFLLQTAAAYPQGALPEPVFLDASDFLDEIPAGHTITDAAQLEVPWLFNNTALVMGTRSNYLAKAMIPEAGAYYLYVRSQGGERSSFRIAVNDKVIGQNLGDGPLGFEKAGAFELEKGPADIRIMRIESSPVFDVLVLTKDPSFGEKDLLPFQLNQEVELLEAYEVPESNAVKFGDVDGDGKTDFMALTRDYSAHVFNHAGEELWSYTAPEEGADARSSFEAPGLVWDMDRDGYAEAIHWRQSEGKEWLVIADGRTGKVKKQTPWPTRPLPHEYNNFRLAIGALKPGYPDNIVVLTDMGGTISVTAYDAGLRQLWQHVENKKKDHLGHYVYPRDLDGDGIDEVVAGSLALDAAGKEIWNRFDLFYDNHDHADSYHFPDLDHDGKPEIVSANSEVGVIAYQALTGEILWQNVAEHSQQIATGNFLSEQEGPQVAIGARIYGNRRAGEPYLWGQVQWFSPDGELILKWPGNPLNGNPVFVQGDWDGDGDEELFWYKFKMKDNGKGELYFPDPVFHMFDFTGDAAEEVITLKDGSLKVFGYREAGHEGAPGKKTPEYLKNKVVNHTHY